MATQCGIAIKTSEGYEAIYVHNNGYPEYMWPMLTEHYNSKEFARKLVSLGDASCIEKNLETGLPRGLKPHPWYTCCFYHRDRGEPWDQVKPITYDTVQKLFACYYFSYVWEDGCWHFYKGGEEIY